MLHQLRCFVMLTETLHYTEAARRLYLSQPSLSYAINTLEKELGVKLFEKQGKTISITKYAEELLPFALSSIHAIDAGMLKIKEMKNPKNFRLGYIYSLAYDFLPSVLTLLPTLADKDQFTFSFYQGQSADLIKRIKEDKLDFAFCPYFEAEGVSSVPIFSQEVFLVAPNTHHLASKKTVKMADLTSEKFALINKGTNLRNIIDDIFVANGIEPDIVFEGEECNSLASFVASEYGISFLPRISSLGSYNLSYLKLDQTPIQRMIYLVWKADGNMTHLGELFKTKLLNIFKNSPQEIKSDIE